MTRKVKMETAVLAGLLIVASAIWYYFSHPGIGSARAALLEVNYKPMSVENSRIHHERVEDARNTDYEFRGRDIFSREQPPPPIPQEVRIPKPGDGDYVPPVVPPPPPPQLSLKFFGSGSVLDGSGHRAFLTDGDAVYIVSEGDTLLGRYRIVKINYANLEFEEIGSGRHGFTVLEEQGSAL
jgi:hypothetical protein